MATDSIQLEGMKSGYHGEVRITPVTLSSGTRTEVPGEGVGNQLHRRKTLLVQNTSTSGSLWMGSENVGYGSGFGGGDVTTCSGVFIGSGESFAVDAGRARFYVFNRETFSVPIKVMETA